MAENTEFKAKYNETKDKITKLKAEFRNKIEKLEKTRIDTSVKNTRHDVENIRHNAKNAEFKTRVAKLKEDSRHLFQFRLYFSIAQHKERNALLKKIYTPSFSKLKKGTKEYLDLGKSGKVWENYFCPFEWHIQDYDFYIKNSSLLNEISVIKDTIKILTKDFFQHMIVNFSHQSCIIEGNSLGIAESQIIWEKINQNYNINDLQHEEVQLPKPKSLLDKPGKEIEVIEIRNHLLITHYLYNIMLKSEQKININNIKKIHYIILKNTPQERVNVWGKIQQAGMFRTVSMQAVGYPLTIYPYGEEVPILMERFIQFYNKTVISDNIDNHKSYQIHPLMNACRILSSFLHIHPFYDGNGRVGRLLMALYLAHNGFPPPVFQQLDQKEYIDALYKAQAEKNMVPLYNIVIGTIFDILVSYM
ncbi:fido domain-containing protein [Glomus cerebriforme]|uniref:Fido domain-containing protein n=1 Tax=Glomus cerebriforme TaxID=658196 RepID=A0A397S4M0_9GLOM|nr:fido domain-containing protein [Glomus cerebriforme]